MTATKTYEDQPQVIETRKAINSSDEKGSRRMWTIFGALAVAFFAVVALWVYVASDSETIVEQEAVALEELVAQERAALDVYFGESDPSDYVAMYADDITYFDQYVTDKIEGQAARDHLMSFAGAIPPLGYEIVNPSVDMRGDTAIFTFNVALFNPGDGTQIDRFNTTEIHERVGDGWEMVHAHWALEGAVAPAPAE
jgi:ketosteroid isomerase-like protein